MIPCKLGVTDLRGCGKDVSPKHINLPRHCICQPCTVFHVLERPLNWWNLKFIKLFFNTKVIRSSDKNHKFWNSVFIANYGLKVTIEKNATPPQKGG
jgi:hypothetical protein